LTDNTTLADALARPRTLTFDGKERTVRVLNFNDLADLEEKFGDLDSIDTGRVVTQRYMIWFILSRTDSELTEQQVGESMTLDKGREIGQFIKEVFALSGFRPSEAGVLEETPSPNAPEPDAAEPATGSETSPSSSSSRVASHRKK